MLLTACAQAGLFLVGVFDILLRADMHLPCCTVNDQRIACLDKSGDVFNHADSRNTECTRDNGNVTGGAAFLEDQTAQSRTVIIEQGGRAHRAGNDDGILGELDLPADHIATDKTMQQSIGQLIKIMQTIPQIGIRLAEHPGAVVGLDALDRSFGGQAGEDCFPQTPHPAGIIGKHAECFKHFPMLTGMGDVAMIDQKIDRGSQTVNRLVQTLFFKIGIIGNQVRDHDARFVHHGMAEANAVREGFSRQRHPATKGDIETGPCEGLQFTRGDHLRQHHGGGLQRLDLFFGIEPVRAVLDNHDAERVTGPQDRNAEEGLIDFFARLGLVREGRMGLGVWQVQGFGLLGDQTHKAFTRFHRC